jgi:hypothetical protein
MHNRLTISKNISYLTDYAIQYLLFNAVLSIDMADQYVHSRKCHLRNRLFDINKGKIHYGIGLALVECRYPYPFPILNVFYDLHKNIDSYCNQDYSADDFGYSAEALAQGLPAIHSCNHA